MKVEILDAYDCPVANYKLINIGMVVEVPDEIGKRGIAAGKFAAADGAKIPADPLVDQEAAVVPVGQEEAAAEVVTDVPPTPKRGRGRPRKVQ